MNRSRLLAGALLTLVLLMVPAPASAQWTIEFFMGDSFSAPTPLTVSQTGYPDVSFTAHYETKPLASRQYYAYRFGKWNGNRGWILEEVHHKIYLTNPTDVVEDFEVSHGYNLVTLNRGWRRGGNLMLLGGGMVVAFPHSTVRGLEYPTKTTNYVLAGATVQGSVGHRFDVSRHVFVSGEAKLTASWARVPIVDGHAKAPNAAFHLLAGGGWQF